MLDPFKPKPGQKAPPRPKELGQLEKEGGHFWGPDGQGWLIFFDEHNVPHARMLDDDPSPTDSEENV